MTEAVADENAAGGAEESVETQLRQQLASAEAAAAAAKEAQIRALAELENVRKRTQRDVENAHRFALERFAGELLAVRDSLELAVAGSADKADPARLIEGQQATLRLLERAFEKFDILKVDPQGGAFDPTVHEAVVMQPSEATANTVLQVVQPGYQLNGRLLRPARVIVAGPLS